MRQILTILLVAAASPALAGEPVRPTPPPAKTALRTLETVQTCGASALQDALAAKVQTPGPRRLGDLPPANMELTVNRRIDGCPVPVIVRYDVDQRRANGLFH